MHPVALKVQDADVRLPADPHDFVHRVPVEVAERAGIDDLQPAVPAGDLREHRPVQGEIGCRVVRAVQMIVAEGAFFPRAARAAQQNDFARIFLGDDRVPLHV